MVDHNKRKFVVHRRELSKEKNNNLQILTNMDEKKSVEEKGPKAKAKKTFSFFYYRDKSVLAQLEKFCTPYKIQKTKKYEVTGKVNFLKPNGAISISLYEYVVKIHSDHYLVLDKESFYELFTIIR